VCLALSTMVVNSLTKFFIEITPISRNHLHRLPIWDGYYYWALRDSLVQGNKIIHVVQKAVWLLKLQNTIPSNMFSSHSK
jgi:hypothetical protein